MLTVDKEIETNVTQSWYAARTATMDAAHRSNIAAHTHKDFFDNPEHVARVESVKKIVADFFPSKRAVYVNKRGISRKPFTVVKVEQPDFPNRLTQAEKDAKFYTPLKDLNVEVVFAKGSNSYLLRIK